MKRKVLIALGVLSICLTASACGSNTTDREQETETIAVMETTEILEVETEAIEISTEQVEESTEDTEAIVQETEIAENKVEAENGEEGTLSEEKMIETSEVGEIVPISYEDYNVNSNGYSNYIE